MHIAYISAGSNLGDRKAHLDYGASCLAQKTCVRQTSSYFETEPVGYSEQPWFLNQVFEVATLLQPRELLLFCQETEHAGGRIRTFPNAPRTLDLDILFYGDAIISEAGLIIPHPRLAERRFVLEPLMEIAPDLRHPVLKKTTRQLLALCPDTSVVRMIMPANHGPLTTDSR